MRLERLLNLLGKSQILITGPNVFYFTGFSGEGWLLFDGKEFYLLTNKLYLEEAKQKVDFINVVDGFNIEWLKKNLDEKDLFVDEVGLNVAEWEGLSASFELIRVAKKVARLRVNKDKYEVENMKKACQIAERVFEELLNVVRVGMTELELVGYMYAKGLELGAEDFSFYPIVATGAGSSVPHYKTSRKLIEEGILLIDFGFKYNGYCSDITRTIFLKKVPDGFDKIYETVLKAKNEAFEKVRAGVKARKIDEVARSFIENAGYGGKFIHGLGHGIGIEVHEMPAVSPGSEDSLDVGVTFTIEPGIYIEGKGGVRLEDDVYVGEKGVEWLSGPAGDIIVVT